MSRVTYIRCDRCGKDFIPDPTHRVGFIGFKWRDVETDDMMPDPNPFEGKDFCMKCMEDIGRYIEGTVIEEEAPPEVDIVIPMHDEPITDEQPAEDPAEAPQKAGEPSEPEKPKKNPPKKKEIDKGKIKALYEAGWSIPKIATEMKRSDSTIYYHVVQMGLKRGDADDQADRSGEGDG